MKNPECLLHSGFFYLIIQRHYFCLIIFFMMLLSVFSNAKK
jgi:hypothetical protein